MSLKSAPAEAAPAAAAAPSLVPVAPPVAVAAGAAAGPAASIEDAPIKAIKILLATAAPKLKKCVDQIPLSKSIKDLVGFKSALQDEIIGDLQQDTCEGRGVATRGGSVLGTGSSGALGAYATSFVTRSMLLLSALI